MNYDMLRRSLQANRDFYEKIYAPNHPTPEQIAADKKQAITEFHRKMAQIESQLRIIEAGFGCFRKFSEDQPRDDHGRWTSGGGDDGNNDDTNQLPSSIADDIGPEPASRSPLPFLTAVGMITGTGEAAIAADVVEEGTTTADAIAAGHAFDKHVIDGGEFPGIQTQQQFSDHIENIMTNPSEVKFLPRGRTAYWDESSGTVVIEDPASPDGGTAFKPDSGKAFFDDLSKE